MTIKRSGYFSGRWPKGSLINGLGFGVAVALLYNEITMKSFEKQVKKELKNNGFKIITTHKNIKNFMKNKKKNTKKPLKFI